MNHLPELTAQFLRLLHQRHMMSPGSGSEGCFTACRAAADDQHLLWLGGGNHRILEFPATDPVDQAGNGAVKEGVGETSLIAGHTGANLIGPAF